VRKGVTSPIASERREFRGYQISEYSDPMTYHLVAERESGTHPSTFQCSGPVRDNEN
jgi:hypothetical protein